MTSNSKNIFYALLLFGGAILIISQFILKTSISDESSDPMSVSDSIRSEIITPVEIATARMNTFAKYLNANGVLRAKREIDIFSRVSGEIRKINVQNGLYVHSEDVLLTIDDREYRLAYEKASNALISAQIDYKTFSSSSAIQEVDSLSVKKLMDEIQSKMLIIENSFKENKINIKDYLRLKRDFETDLAYLSVHRGDVMANKSGLSHARESFERAKLDFEATVVKAPFDGFIANNDLASGMYIHPQKKLFTIIDMSSMMVDVEILETEIAKVKVGIRAKIIINALPNEHYDGIVSAINPTVDTKSKSVKVSVKLVNVKQLNLLNMKLRPGMDATVRIEIVSRLNRLLIPKEAILTRDQKTLVFVASNGRAKWHYVTVKDENDRYVEIENGLKNGDSVIVKGQFSLADDARIQKVN